MINFLPLIEPPEPSYQAAMAYRSYAFLPAAEVDLMGWKTQAPIMLEGILFGVRPVSVKYTVRKAVILSRSKFRLFIDLHF
jgi:hypothetical protein